MNANLRNFGLWLIIVLLLLAVFTLFQNPSRRPAGPAGQAIPFSQFLDLVGRGNVRAVDIDGPDIQISTILGETFRTIAPNDPTLVQRLHAKGVDLQSKRQMLEIARGYEYLAQRAEERRRGPDNPA